MTQFSIYYFICIQANINDDIQLLDSVYEQNFNALKIRKKNNL